MRGTSRVLCFTGALLLGLACAPMGRIAYLKPMPADPAVGKGPDLGVRCSLVLFNFISGALAETQERSGKTIWEGVQLVYVPHPHKACLHVRSLEATGESKAVPKAKANAKSGAGGGQ